MASNEAGTCVKSDNCTLHRFRQTRRRLFWLVASVCVVIALGVGAEEQKKHPITEIKIRKLDASEAAKVSYALQIKPLLAENCDECHSSDEHKGSFEISSVAKLIKGGKKASPA